MSDDEQSLVELNKETFAAEAHKPKDSWVDVLHRSLADDFRLRRAIGETEDRERMIARLSHTTPVERELLGDPTSRFWTTRRSCAHACGFPRESSTTPSSSRRPRTAGAACTGA